jgi:hypothetical protein
MPGKEDTVITKISMLVIAIGVGLIVLAGPAIGGLVIAGGVLGLLIGLYYGNAEADVTQDDIDASKDDVSSRSTYQHHL